MSGYLDEAEKHHKAALEFLTGREEQDARRCLANLALAIGDLIGHLKEGSWPHMNREPVAMGVPPGSTP